MPRVFRLLIIASATVALAACGEFRKPEQPNRVAVAPEVVEVTKRVYVPVPKALTKAEPVAEGPIAQCFDVAAQRRAALERANAKLLKIDAIQGTEVKP